jgi:hypothetical protein
MQVTARGLPAFRISGSKKPSRTGWASLLRMDALYGLTTWMAWLPWGMATTAVGWSPVG